MVVMKKPPSHSWWFDSHHSPRQSPWLASTLSEIDEQTKAMLKLIEDDADSFAQRAEMYYRKRPELVNMVEDFYRAHRSLAERYDQLKLEVGLRHATTLGSPLSTKSWSKSRNRMDKASRTYSDSFDSESEIDDPEQEENEVDSGTNEVSNKSSVIEKTNMSTKEVERLKEENKNLKANLAEKDEEKREVFRQLSLSIDILKEENVG